MQDACEKFILWCSNFIFLCKIICYQFFLPSLKTLWYRGFTNLNISWTGSVTLRDSTLAIPKSGSLKFIKLTTEYVHPSKYNSCCWYAQPIKQLLTHFLLHTVRCWIMKICDSPQPDQTLVLVNVQSFAKKPTSGKTRVTTIYRLWEVQFVNTTSRYDKYLVGTASYCLSKEVQLFTYRTLFLMTSSTWKGRV